jgi:hypothetical protein
MLAAPVQKQSFRRKPNPTFYKVAVIRTLTSLDPSLEKWSNSHPFNG